jgi:tetratricopeptide (TPR) repeat protein
MTIALGISFLIIQVMSLVLFVIVLIKLFKKEGVLKGILGFFCGIYTFIWGWLKHKELALTKVMALWSIFIVASMVLPSILATSGAYELLSLANTIKGTAHPEMTEHRNTVKRSLKALAAQRKEKKKAETAKEAANKNVDWSQEALALWQNGNYKDPDRAVDYWSRAIAKNQNTAEIYNNRGLAYYDLKLYQKAIEDYNRAIQLDSGYAAAFNNRGNAYYELAEYQKALMDFNKSLQLRSNYPTAHLNRGLVYYQLDKNDQACRDFQNACDQGECIGLKWAMKNGMCTEGGILADQLNLN